MTAASNRLHKVVIVGAGHGGGSVAAGLRQQGFDGEIMLIGTEPVGPYHRPPLSKSLLKGEFTQPLAPESFYADNEITLRTATCVHAVDRAGKAVILTDGERVSYDVLVLATGARARRLDIPGADLAHVYELRTVAHAEVLANVLSPSDHLAIVGGGWIGLEVTASARRAGVEVTVLEREDRLLARVASEPLSAFLTEHHRAQGATIVTGAQVTGLSGLEDQVAAVRLADGTEIAADHVLIGVGAVAEDRLAAAAGLRCADGVVVDYAARTEDPNIYAVGDVTRRPITGLPGLYRLESIPSTLEQTRQAVAAMLGKPAPHPEVPWFWSDQYDLKLQIAGLTATADTVTVRSDPTQAKLAVFHTCDERLVALEGVNAASEFMAARQFIRDGAKLDLDGLADAAVSLDQLVIQAAAPSATATEARSPVAGSDVRPTTLQPPGPGGTPGRPLATFITADGGMHSVEIPVGTTLMEGSISNNLPGIIAECGGMCSCGTCHVYVEPPWEAGLPEPEYEEEDLLEFIEARQDNSRLSCQLVMTDELDGIVVRVADFT